MNNDLGAPRRVRSRDVAWRGAAVALLVVTAAIVGYNASDQLIDGALLRSAVPLLVNLAGTAVIAGVVVLVLRFTLGRRRRLRLLFIGSAIWCLVTLVTLSPGPSLLAWGLVVLVVMIAVPIVGYAIPRVVASRRSGVDGGTDVSRRLVVGAVVALALIVGLAAVLAWPGPARRSATSGSDARTAADSAPGRGTGSYRVITYGSGDDGQRPEFGADADLIAPPVDATALIRGWAPGSVRSAVWGFAPNELPRNGTIWLPDGAGPFPLVVMVHGNNSAVRHSDPGLAYLGETLASQGIIAVSIDENFLGTNVLDRTGPITGVPAARAWLILEHLRQFDAWSQEGGHPLERMVDMDAVGLLGHSRGGEAVATAAYLNELPALPEHPEVTFDHDYGIQAVMGLAPSDGLYMPGGEPVRLQGIDYLAIQGTWDADVVGFDGEKQWQRVEVSDDTTTTMVYLDRANHTQFNTAWGRYDLGQGLPKHVLNTGGLIDADDQRAIASTYAGAFFRSTLLDDPEAFARLVEGSAGAPRLASVQRSASGGVTYMLTDEEDRDPATGADGVTVQSEGAGGWDVIAQPMRAGPSYGRVTRLRWDGAGGDVVLRISTDAAVADARAVVFDLADARPPQAAGDALDIAVELTDQSGQTTRLEPAQVGAVPTPLDASYLKWSALQVPPTSVPLFQTFRVQLAPLNDEIDLSQLRSISLVFTGNSAGTVLVDNVGLAG
jgi:hypothetical protein